MGGSRGDRGSGPPLKNHKNIGFLSNAGPDPLKNLESIKPAFNFEHSSARQWNGIKWRFAGGPMVAQHWMLDLYICSFVIFQGIRTSIALETLYFWNFSTGGVVQIPCLRWRPSIVENVFDCRLSDVGGYTQFGRCILVENLKHPWNLIS